jgi:hypothetical protein
LATLERHVARPAFSSISPAADEISPGIMSVSWVGAAPPSDDRLVDGHQLGAVGKGRFDLDVGIISARPSITSSRVSSVVP